GRDHAVQIPVRAYGSAEGVQYDALLLLTGGGLSYDERRRVGRGNSVVLGEAHEGSSCVTVGVTPCQASRRLIRISAAARHRSRYSASRKSGVLLAFSIECWFKTLARS